MRPQRPASASTEWQHQSDSVTTLTTGAVFATNGGGEQGDLLGTILSSRETRGTPIFGTITPLLFEQKGVCNWWVVFVSASHPRLRCAWVVASRWREQRPSSGGQTGRQRRLRVQWSPPQPSRSRIESTYSSGSRVAQW